MGHLVQSIQGARSLKTKLDHSQATITPEVGTQIKPSQEIHIHIEHIRKLYTDNTERFLICYRSGNQ